MKNALKKILLGMALICGSVGVCLTLSQNVDACPIDSRLCFSEGSIDNVKDTSANLRNTVMSSIEILAALVGAVSIMGIMYNAMMYSFSLGDPGKASKAKQGIVFSITGAVIAAGATIITGLVAMVANVGDLSELPAGILTLANWFAIMTGSGMLLAAAYGGFLMATSAGNPQKVQLGKKCIIAGITGIVITVFAHILLGLFVGAIG